MPSRYRSVIFDLDGTLVDTLRDVSISINHALTIMGHAPISEEEARRVVGPGKEAFIAAVFRDVPDPDEKTFLNTFRDHYWDHCLDHTTLFPGLQEVIDSGKSGSLAVATNKPRRFTERILEGLGIRDRFDAVVGPDDVVHAKPHPEMIFKILESLGARPSETLFVGDTDKDMLAGRGAGVSLCGVRWGYGDRVAMENTRPDFLIDSAGELLELMSNHHP